MLKKFLLVSSFVLLGSIASFAQNSTDSCPIDQIQEVVEVTVDLGIVEGSYKETECTPKDSDDKNDSNDNNNGSNDNRPEPRDPQDRPREELY